MTPKYSARTPPVPRAGVGRATRPQRVPAPRLQDWPHRRPGSPSSSAERQVFTVVNSSGHRPPTMQAQRIARSPKAGASELRHVRRGASAAMRRSRGRRQHVAEIWAAPARPRRCGTSSIVPARIDERRDRVVPADASGRLFFQAVEREGKIHLLQLARCREVGDVTKTIPPPPSAAFPGSAGRSRSPGPATGMWWLQRRAHISAMALDADFSISTGVFAAACSRRLEIL